MFSQPVAELTVARAVVVDRLRAARSRAEVLEAIQDCVINVIGSEELAIYAPSGRGLERVQAFGAEDREPGPVAPGVGPIGRAAAGGGWARGDGPPPADAPDLTACVPLRWRRELEAVLAIWRMLPHKPVFGEGERRVLRLLAAEGAAALHGARAGNGG